MATVPNVVCVADTATTGAIACFRVGETRNGIRFREGVGGRNYCVPPNLDPTATSNSASCVPYTGVK